MSAHISSFVILCRPQERHIVSMAVADLPGVEIYHVADNGRIVALAEGDGEHVGYALTQMQSLPGVIAANMVYHGMDDSEDDSEDENG